MKKINSEFLDEYKQLDKLCADMFSVKAGVSEYIKKMDEVSEQGKLAVESWTADYKNIKHLRWLRNKIAHETECPDCTKEDRESLKAIIAKLNRGTDPLSLYYKFEKTRKKNAGISPALVLGIIAAIIIITGLLGFFMNR